MEQLLLRAVRILLECILVMAVYEKIFTHHDSDRLFSADLLCASKN